MRADVFFVQIPDWVTDSDISHGAYRLYGVLDTYANRDTGKCHPSYATLAERMKCSRRQVVRYLKELEGIGAVAVAGRVSEKNEHIRSSNEYTIIKTQPGIGSDTHVTGVVTPMSPPSDTHVTTGSDTHVTGVVTPVAPKQEPKNKNQKNKNQEQESARKRDNNRGHRVPENFMPAQKHIDKIRKLKPGLNLDIEHTKFMNHWLSSTGSNATKKDWGRAWENWMLNAREERREYKPGWQKRAEFNAQQAAQYGDSSSWVGKEIES